MIFAADRNGTLLEVGDTVKVIGSQIATTITKIYQKDGDDYITVADFSRELNARIVILYKRAKPDEGDDND